MAKESYMHGGFFSPAGYFKVETGGKHDENPNGGVQIGVDEQGVPNMLEEGEPVYNDYVYSDNIIADVDVLKAHNLPIKYAGKLFSDIADSFVDEAEERPLDSVSNNGLRVMLARLADAQEVQKEKQKDKELEDELAQLSPEELEMLEQQLAAEEQAQATPQEQMMPMMANGGLIRRFDIGGPTEPVLPEFRQGYPQQSIVGRFIPGFDDKMNDLRIGYHKWKETPFGQIASLAIPDFSNGMMSAISLPAIPAGITDVNILGQIKTYSDDFARGEKLIADSKAAGIAKDVAKKMKEDGNRLMKTSADYIKKLIKQSGVKAPKNSSNVGKSVAKALTSKPAKIGYGIAGLGAAGLGGYEWYKSSENKKPLIFVDEAEDYSLDDIILNGFSHGGLMRRFDNGGSKSDAIRKYLISRMFKTVDENGVPSYNFGYDAYAPDFMYKDGDYSGNAYELDMNVGHVLGAAMSGNIGKDDYESKLLESQKANGFLSYLAKRGYGYESLSGLTQDDLAGLYYDYAMSVAGPLELERRYQQMIDYDTEQQLYEDFIKSGERADIDSDKFKSYLRTNSPELFYRKYPDEWNYSISKEMNNVRELDPVKVTSEARKPRELPKEYGLLPNPGRLALHVPHISDDIDIPEYSYIDESLLSPIDIPSQNLRKQNFRYNPSDYDVRLKQFDFTHDVEGPDDVDLGGLGDVNPKKDFPELFKKGDKKLPTWQRYAAPIGHAILGLHNAVTPPTKFRYQRFIPQTVSGNLSLVDPRYQPVPMGMLMNETLAQGAGTIDALRNAGLGPSTGAAIVAADRSIGRNIGDTFLSGWQANNNQRNQIIGAINNNRQAAADFNYRLALANATAREKAQQSDIVNDLYVQRLNDAAESEKYAAISNELGYALNGLSGIGTENFNMNMANSVYPYVIDEQGYVRYIKPSAMGGLLKVYKG